MKTQRKIIDEMTEKKIFWTNVFLIVSAIFLFFLNGYLSGKGIYW